MSNVDNLIAKFAKDNISKKNAASLTNINICHVFEDRYRVNVWVKLRQDDDNLLPSIRVAESFLVEVVDNVVVDKTITKIHQVR